MERTHVDKLKELIGSKVKVSGFVHANRDQGNIKFILLRDVTGIIQAVVFKSNNSAFDASKSLTLESVISIEGLLKESNQAPNGIEIEAEKIEVLSLADPQLPIPVVVEKGGAEPEQPVRLDYRWIDLRRPEKKQIFELWTALEKGMRRYYDEQGFMQIYTPSFMSAPSETGAECFEIPYFDKKAYLAQSPQFYKQMALAGGFEKVFSTGPVFRAEQSFTTRHLTEFTGWDFEMAYINSYEDVMQTLSEMLKSAFEYAKNELPSLKIEIPTLPFPKLSMAEAKSKLKEKGVPSEKEHDISPEEERGICEIIKEDTGHDFVFITDYHTSVRPFYHMRHEGNPELTLSYDLLYKGVEITTGAQREHRYNLLIEQAKEKGMSLELLNKYLEFFKWGCPPHGGGGIGPARIIMRILDLPNVNESTFLARNVRRLTP